MRPRVGVGKDAKYKGVLKPRDARKLDKELRVPPHKKPRVYAVSVEYAETITHREVHRYPNKAARDEATRRIKRELVERKKRYNYSGLNWDGANVVHKETIGPIVTEYMDEEASTPPSE